MAAQRIVGDEALFSPVGVSTMATGTFVSLAISGAAVL